MGEHNDIGSKGEDLAVDFLERNGYEILRRNFKFRRYEIDIIAMRGDWLLFIEVKTRTNLDYGTPEEFVLSEQSKRIMQVAEEFIFTTNWQGHIRFDIISVTIGDYTEVIHFEDAIN